MSLPPLRRHTSMGKIIGNFFIALDGVVESPDKWHYTYFNEEMGAAISAGTSKADAFLMGRVLYEEWAAYWPGNDDDFGGFINSTRKIVLSNTLSEASWGNTTLISGDDAAEQLRQIKAETVGDIGMCGSATTVRWLLANDLLDELNLLIHPIVVGAGQRLFEDSSTVALQLVQQKTFSTGVIHATYAPAQPS